MVDFWNEVRNLDQLTVGASSKNLENGGGGGVTNKSNETQKLNLIQSVLHSGNDLLNELQSKFNAALSFGEDDEDNSDLDIDDLHYEHDDVGRASSSTTASDVLCGCAGGGGAIEKECTVSSKTSESDFVLVKRVSKTSRVTSRSHRRSHLETSNVGSSSSSSKSRVRPRRPMPSKSRHRNNRQKCHSEAISSTESASEAEGNDAIRTTVLTNSSLSGTPSSTPAAHSQDSSSFSIRNSASEGSLLSWTSSLSCDSQTDEGAAGCMQFMKEFVGKLFRNNTSISLEEKAKFGELCQLEAGRLWFSRYVTAQRVHNRKVDESTFYSLVQYFAIVLFECSEADDYAPAKTLMNMCFTYYYEFVSGRGLSKEFLYIYLKDQPIWQSLRFWNAAFFDAVQCERAHKPLATREDVERYSPEEICDEQEFQENITFGQLGSFTCNMHAFGLNREMCLEFLRKQSIIANLGKDQVKMLRENINRMYR